MCDDLAEVLANRRWLRRQWPFPHVVARQVFHEAFYEALADQLRTIVDLGLSETPDRSRFSRNIAGYDSYGIGFSPATPYPIGLFLSAQWRDLISNLFGISPTPYVFAGSHYHTVGSQNGFIHTDLNPVWFPLTENGNIQVPNNEQCSYKTGVGPLDESAKVRVVRGAAVLFYLLNDGWRHGDGGETGLYASPAVPVSAAVARCPPINNSLLAFECTPRSLHTFLANTRLPRASVIMWVHRPWNEAVAKFGEDMLERWKA